MSSSDAFKKYTKRSLKKIVNIYQHHYKNWIPSGFGDYIRGSFTLIQIIHSINHVCGTNILFEMDLSNHPFSNWLLNITNKNKKLDYVNIEAYTDVNMLKVKDNPNEEIFTTKNSPDFIKKFIEFLNQLDSSTEILNTFFLSYEIYDQFNTFQRDTIKSYLVPTTEMVHYIDDSMDNLSISKKNYNVIHIRCPDTASFPQKEFKPEYLSYIDNQINNVINIKQINSTFVLLSNNICLKNYLTKTYKNIKTLFNDICHTGMKETQTNKSVKDTLLDFYLLGYSNKIIAFSSYIHGTGFSKESAKLFDVPYQAVQIGYSDDFLIQ